MKNVAVLGLGKVGELVATLLHEAEFKVTALDAAQPHQKLPFAVKKCDVSRSAELKTALQGQHAVVSCLPYHLNLAIAEMAQQLGLHYFDLTEDVPTTTAIQQLAKSSRGVMAPQCGLAPGFIGIVGAHLAKEFDSCRSMELRVGALPLHPRGKLGYAFNWSPEGVINEYINDCEVIEGGKRKWMPALEGLETIFIDGVALEAFYTSGGLGTLCDTMNGKVERLNYKSMRYPGHCQHMRFLLNELHLRAKREQLQDILQNALPPVEEDVVYVHAAVEGQQKGRLQRAEFVRAYFPLEIGEKTWRAISWTTAASVCAVIEMVRDGTLPNKGFIKQEEIPLDAFLATPTGSLYTGEDEDDGLPGKHEAFVA